MTAAETKKRQLNRFTERTGYSGSMVWFLFHRFYYVNDGLLVGMMALGVYRTNRTDRTNGVVLPVGLMG